MGEVSGDVSLEGDPSVQVVSSVIARVNDTTSEASCDIGGLATHSFAVERA